MKKIAMVAVFALTVSVWAVSAYASEGEDHGNMKALESRMSLEDMKAAPTKEADGTIHLNNQLCPVSGGKISGKHSYNHHGVVYNMCCKMCAGKFEKNSEKYAHSMDEINHLMHHDG